MIVLNFIIDVIFTADLALQFVLMYPTSSAALGTRWVQDPIEIATHYVRTWFVVDLVSIIPFQARAQRPSLATSSVTAFKGYSACQVHQRISTT